MRLFQAMLMAGLADDLNEGNRERVLIRADSHDEVFDLYLNHLVDSYLLEDGTCPFVHHMIGIEDAVEVDEVDLTLRDIVGPQFAYLHNYVPFTLPRLATEAVIARVHHEHKEAEAKRNAEVEEQKRIYNAAADAAVTQLLAAYPSRGFPIPAWSPDGRTIILTPNEPPTLANTLIAKLP